MVKKSIKVKEYDVGRNNSSITELLKSSMQNKSARIDNDSGGIIIPPYDPISLASLMEVNTYHRRCIGIKSACVSDLGWHIEGEDEKEIALLKNWVKNCTEEEDFSSVITKFIIDYIAIGYSFLETARDPVEGKPQKIYHARAATVKIAENGNSFIQTKNSKDTKFLKYQPGQLFSQKHEMIFFKQYSPLHDWYGIPDWLPSLAAMIGDRDAMQYNINYFTNNAIPPLLILIKGGELSTKVEKTLQSFLQENVKGVANAHRAISLSLEDPEQEIELKELGKQIVDQAFGEFRKANRDEVASIHGVPPRLLGIVSSGSLGGTGEVEGQLKIFKETLIDPLQRRLEYLLNTLLVRKGLGIEKARIKFNELDITAQNNDSSYFNAMATAYAQLVNAGILSADEAAKKLNIQKNDKRPGLKEQLLIIQKSIENAIYGK